MVAAGGAAARGGGASRCAAMGALLGLLGGGVSLAVQSSLHAAGGAWIPFAAGVAAWQIAVGAGVGLASAAVAAGVRMRHPGAAAAAWWTSLWGCALAAMGSRRRLFEAGLSSPSPGLAAVLCGAGIVIGSILAGALTYRAAVALGARLQAGAQDVAVSLACGAGAFLIAHAALAGGGRGGASLARSAAAALLGLAAVAAPLIVLTGLRRRGLAAAGWALLLALAWALPAARWAPGGPGGAVSAGADRHSVVLVVVDTLRADRIRGAAAEGLATPAFRRLEREGYTFTRAVPTASFTVASVASLLTGLPPVAHGARSQPSSLRSEVETLAEAFSSAGYATGGFVANGLLGASEGFGRGFERYVNLRDGVLRTSPEHFLAGLLRGPFEAGMGAAPGVPDFRALRWTFLGEPDHDEAATRLAASWVRAQAGRPFFLWVHYFGPHFPYEPPAGPLPGAAPAEGLAEFGRMMRDYYAGRLTTGAVNFECPLSAAGRAGGAYLYDREVEQVDREIAGLLEALERAGRLDDTILAVTSDHGESLGEHGLTFTHSFYVYDTTTTVPLVVSRPGKVARGVATDVSISLLDLAPTLLDLSGVAGGLGEGRSLAGHLKEGTIPDPEITYSESLPLLPNYPERKRIYVDGVAGKMRALRAHPWKIVLTPRPADAEWELYDLDADPGESRNLAGTQPHVESALRAWMIRELRREGIEGGPSGGREVAPEEMEMLRSLGYVN